MFQTKHFISILVFVCSLLSVLPLPLDDEEGTIVSDNPKIEGEDKEIDDPTLMYSNDSAEGDVQLTETQKSEYENQELMKSGAVHKKYKWNKNIKRTHVIIPYLIDNDSGYTDTQFALIRQGMDDIEKYTCVNFVERINQKDYLRIYSGKGCSSKVGKVGGMQNLSLNHNGCMIRKKIVHELIHAIGFNHMHKRFDRDSYVTIEWQNISPDYEKAFKKLDNQYEAFNTKYDLLSCMHYGKKAFSTNKEDTIVPKNTFYLDKIGNVTTLSKGDARRINRMYDCSV